MDLVSFGELLLDMFASETGRDFSEIAAFIPVPGGGVANVAVAAARLGAQSAFIGKVGDDAFGRRLAKVMVENGVDTRGMRFDPGVRTTVNFMALRDEHSVECLFYRNPGADMMFRPEEIDKLLIESARFFHFGGVTLTEEPCRSATLEAARIARKAGAMVSFDVNYRPTLWKDPGSAIEVIERGVALAHIVKVNEIELRLLAGADDPAKGCPKLLEAGPALSVATLGPKGCFFAARGASGSVPGFTVNTVDATGCGDAFMAALLCRLIEATTDMARGARSLVAALKPKPLAAALTYANAAGALTATRKGVISALPTASEVEKLLRERGH